MKAYRKQLRVYHMILSLYPEEYRQNYGSEMVQTFEDMLTAQTSRLGRLSIWLRTLRQLPWSVANEKRDDTTGRIY